MKHYTEAYPEPITRLLNENKYLKSEKAMEKEKLENTIKIFQKKIEELIPGAFAKSAKFKKTGLAAIFSASLELAKDGLLDIMQKKLFDDILIKSSIHTPLKLRTK